MKISTSLLFIGLCINAFGQKLVLPGDYPDPSVVKIGDTYWASATTSNWAPAFPLLKSKDLINWETIGHVFNPLPAWADYYFWAPEISYENGKVYMYYSAHKKGGNLCVGIASADKPEGPYKDHGPIICQEVGSIDAFPIRDENGKLHIVWKEDANSIGKPTPIWIQELNEERTALLGQKKLMFRNDASWEGNLVEGVSIIRNGKYFYAFYAGAGCCGRGCTYANGIARSEKLSGPWEKYKNNPVLAGSDIWKCPGHGTSIQKENRNFFMYHAYHKEGDVYTGRQGLIMEYIFTPDGWIKFLPAPEPLIHNKNIIDDFNGAKISNSWQWSVFQKPEFKLAGGKLILQASEAGTFIGHKTFTSSYSATVRINKVQSNADFGLGAIGDENNLVSIIVRNSEIRIEQIKDGKENVIHTLAFKPKKKIYLRMEVSNGKDISFSYSVSGKKYVFLTLTPVDGFFLPPWDRAVRTGLISRGQDGQKAVFDQFILESR